MMINLNKDAIEKYKKDIGITKEQKGNLNLFNWIDELSYLEDIAEDNIEEDLAECDFEEEVNTDMEEESEVEEDQKLSHQKKRNAACN